jgi:GDP-4-dehydro-6-deoxy-D-mannose reductase
VILKAFITGIAGFAGSHLAEFLLAHSKLEISGLVHDRSNNVAHLRDRVVLHRGDLLDPSSTLAVLTAIQPDFVFHLAGQSFVPSSWNNPWQTFESNVRGQLNLLEAVAQVIPRSRVLIVGSNEEYGSVLPEHLPVDEEVPLRPDSPYGVSKVAQDLMGLQYHLSKGLETVRVRPFNHIGPRQSERFVASALARQIAEIEAGLRPATLQVGNLRAQRDFTDVRDTVRAYYLIVQRGVPGEVYNIGSGVPHSIQELLDVLLDLAQVEVKVKLKVEVDQTRLRPSDVPLSYCDYSRLYACTGWQPSIPFAQGLGDTLDYWRERVKEGVERQP